MACNMKFFVEYRVDAVYNMGIQPQAKVFSSPFKGALILKPMGVHLKAERCWSSGEKGAHPQAKGYSSSGKGVLILRQSKGVLIQK